MWVYWLIRLLILVEPNNGLRKSLHYKLLNVWWLGINNLGNIQIKIHISIEKVGSPDRPKIISAQAHMSLSLSYGPPHLWAFDQQPI